ncbi:MAG: hypothetical protein V4478_02545 [Patescibacteria group bacterium]
MATKLPELEENIIAHLTIGKKLDSDATKLLLLIKEWNYTNTKLREKVYDKIKIGYQFRCSKNGHPYVWNELHHTIKTVIEAIDETDAMANLSACNPIPPTQAMIDEAAGRVSVEIVRSPTLAYDIYPLSYLQWFGSRYPKTLATI